MRPSPTPVQDERDNNEIPETPCADQPRKRGKKTINASYRVELVTADSRNPANPTSHLTPVERGQRVAKLWAELFRRLLDGK